LGSSQALSARITRGVCRGWRAVLLERSLWTRLVLVCMHDR
jgi:hypothetical protein